MFSNYLKVLFRSLIKHKSYMLISLSGLAVALVCALLATAYILDDLSYDQFHSKKDNIYRLYKENVSINDGSSTLTSETSGLMGPTIASDYPEVVNFVRVLPWFDEVVISHEDQNIKIPHAVFADSSFFEVFDFSLVKGNPREALNTPLDIVLSASLAKKLFKDANPIGKTVKGLNDLDYTITGIVEDAPKNSHIQYDALISYVTTTPGVGPMEFEFMNNWLGQTVFTYLEMTPGADVIALESKMPEMMASYFPERKDSYFLKFQPLKDIYLYSLDIKTYADIKTSSFTYTKVFGLAALFIIIIACVNYVNINTAKATKRASEIGVRKVLGASKSQLIRQFMGEALLITLFAAFLAVLVADLTLPYFNALSGKQLTAGAIFSTDTFLILGILLMLMVLTSGFYPALVLSSFQPSAVLTSNAKSKISGNLPRKVLIVFQFAISIALIAGTIVVYQQTRFFQTKDLGFDKEHVVVININNSLEDSYQSFRNELIKHRDIQSVAVCQATVGSGTFGTTVIPEEWEEEFSANVFRVDTNFIQTMGIEMDAGKHFTGTASDSGSVIVNQTFARQANWLDPLDKTIKFSPDGDKFPVIGVVKDFHFEGLNTNKVKPIIMYLYPRNFTNVTARISGDNIQETLAYMRELWNRYETRYPFDYYFADTWFDHKYKQEAQLLDTITVFSLISIMLACLGLYGLAAFTIEQRLKEIGIRKVLGATVSSITLMINKKFMHLILLAFVVAAPLAWWNMQEWLTHFAYSIELTAWPFVVAVVMTLIITIVAVSIQALKAAFINPVNILKSE
ncbi:MAG: FtsX-like permease family protein [Fulvivirga sp.]|nr:FtsX-like permease family protein [Fulvivirga sp.]